MSATLSSAALLLLCACASLWQAEAQTPRRLGEIPVNLAGFSSLYIHEDATDPTEKYSILLSTFNPIPFTSDTSYIYRHVGKYLDNLAEAPGTALYNDYTWPREPSQTPVDVFGFETITQPDGFLPPGKNDGSVHIIDYRNPSSPRTLDILYDFFAPDAWFYHRVLWKDMDGDGKKDGLASRAYQDLFTGETTTQLIWFKQPGNPIEETPWSTTVLNTQIADTFSVFSEVAGTEVLFTVGYFTEKLAVHWTTNPQGLWANPEDIETRIIDTGFKFFDVEVTDLNNDGNPDLLVTLNAEVNGTLVAYEIPEDFKTGDYERHVMASGFNSRSGLFGGGSPGSGIPFYPEASEAGKPYIMLSGDDEGTCYYMRAKSSDVNDWTYDVITIVDEGEGQIIGKPSVADVDGDGYKEVFIPSYFEDKMYVYTFKP